jgi:hypothetical protein
MATLDEAYSSIADVNSWLKIRAGENLVLSDIPSIIPLRWTYFKNSWEFIKSNISSKIKQNPNPDFLNDQIKEFTKFIEFQRNISNRINPFSDGQIFHRFSAVFDIIDINSINLTNEEQKIIDNEIARISIFSKNDFLLAKKNITDYRDRITDIYGLGDQDYNAVFNKSPIAAQSNATIVDINYLLTLQGSLKTIDFILANLFAVDTALDPFALARANANNPDVNIGQYKSGKLVRLNYGESLQILAKRHLGDPDKWIDIAIANGLKPPYIDEVGQQISLLSNGNGNQINIAGTDLSGQLNIGKLYINQPVFLQSNVERTVDQRTIINIREVPISGEIILELDGELNLDIYKLIDSAHIRVFQPNTVNSSFFVLIPTTDPLPDDRQDEVPWFLAKSPEDEKRAKIDLFIDTNGELVFTPNSDVKLSYGLENAVQAIKLKIITELGSLRYHSTFGLVNVLGTKNTNIDDTVDLITQSIVEQVGADSRFDRIENLTVDYLVNSGTNEGVAAIIINLTVRLAGGNQVIPISFTVNNN